MISNALGLLMQNRGKPLVISTREDREAFDSKGTGAKFKNMAAAQYLGMRDGFHILLLMKMEMGRSDLQEPGKALALQPTRKFVVDVDLADNEPKIVGMTEVKKVNGDDGKGFETTEIAEIDDDVRCVLVQSINLFELKADETLCPAAKIAVELADKESEHFEGYFSIGETSIEGME